jgi:response regulator RpfG family c-di-GMP phosphodiesterase
MSDATSYMYRLLLVDDEPNILKALQRVFREIDDTEVLTAGDAVAAAAILKEKQIDLVISDEKMPGVAGHKFIQFVKEHYPETLRIILTGYSDMEAMRHAVNRGDVYRYLFKPWDDNELIVVVKNALEHARVSRERDELNHQLIDLVEQRTRELNKALEYIRKQKEETQESLNSTFAFLESVISFINRETGEETMSKQVVRLARRLAEAVSLDEQRIRYCEMAGHFFPISALSLGYKPEEVADPEGEIRPDVLEMSEHLLGKTLKITDLATMARHVGERWDGSGKPDGLADKSIPMVSRILRVAFDFHTAVHTGKVSPREALNRIQSHSGTIYDPTVVSRLTTIISEKEPMPDVLRIPISKVLPGMTLAADIKLENGMTYLTAGTDLSREMVNSILARVNTPHFPLSSSNEVLISKGRSGDG